MSLGICMRAYMHAQLHPTLGDPMDCSPPGSSVLGISQARILEWIGMPSSSRSSRPRNGNCISGVSCIGRWVLHHSCHLGSLHWACDLNMNRFVFAHAQSCLTLCDPLGLYSGRILCPWNFSGKNIGVGCHLLLQKNSPIQWLTQEYKYLISPFKNSISFSERWL